MESSLAFWDLVVIVAYFVVVFAVGITSSFFVRGNLVGYFLAGRNMHWILVGASLFASNIGSGHFVGLAGSGAASGIAIAGFELNAIFILVVLGWLFLPVYIASGIYTMPGYIHKRFGGQRIRTYLSVLALLLYIFTKISADLFAGAIFINQSLRLNLYLSISILLIIACIFTAAGGLTAVIYTDTVQTIIMLMGGFVLMIISFIKIGGYSVLQEKYMASIPMINYTLNASQCRGLPREDSFNLLRDPISGDLPWTGMAFGLTISSIWYWCSDQVIVQRALAAKNFSQAKASCIFAGCLKFLPMWLLVFPGMIARILYPGLRGLMLACMLSALMSSLTSVFNSSSTIFTLDIYKLIRKNASEKELIFVGRSFVVFIVIISIVWIPIIDSFPSAQLFVYIQSVTSYLAPPICAVYVLAIFVPRVNEPGAFWGLMSGLAFGMLRFIVEIVHSSRRCDQPNPQMWFIFSIHYLHFGILLCLFSAVVTFVISMLTPPIAEKHLYRLTFWSRFSDEDRVSISDEDNSKFKNLRGSAIYSVEKVSARIEQDQKSQEQMDKEKKLELELAQEKQHMDKDETTLDENLTTKRLINGMAIIIMIIAVFIYIYYS